MIYKLGSARWDERKEGGWKEQMDDWKLQQGNLGQEFEDSADPDMAMYVPICILKQLISYILFGSFPTRTLIPLSFFQNGFDFPWDFVAKNRRENSKVRKY